MRKALSISLCALLISTAFALFGPNIVVTDVSAEIIEGEGNCFEVTNSTYLNVTLCSSEVVNVTLESIPDVVSFTIENVTSAQSTEITISGFEPDMTYYRHQDGHLMENFTADENGNYSYTQDISEPHHVFIQEEASTKYIRDDATGGDCYLIGTWDFPAKTCTLTSDVFEMIVIDANGITLDGGGHSVTEGVSAFGIHASWRSGVTIKNVVVSGFSYGIYLWHSESNTISGNTVSGKYFGIRLDYIGSSTISGNTVSGGTGIHLVTSSSNTISGNTVSGSIHLRHHCSSNTISGNTVSGKYDGIVLDYSHSITISGNTVSGSNYYNGISLWSSHSITISGNTVSGSNSGIYLWSSHSSTISGNTVSGKYFGIYLWSSHSITISGNTFSGNFYGIQLYESSSNTIFHNNFVDNTIQLYNYGSTNTWDNGDGEGNYWSDYAGVDDGSGGRVAGDGVGDTDLPHQGVDWYPLTDAQPNTEEGTNVEIFAGAGVEMHFSEVTSPGFTYAKEVSGSPPAHFRFVPINTFYDISTTASFTGIINISISYDDTSLSPGKEKNLKLLHWDGINGIWVDITTWVDLEEDRIYGETDALSIFAIMVDNEAPVAIITAPESGSLYEVGTTVEFTGTFTDEDTEDTHTAQWSFTTQGQTITIDGTVAENGGSGFVSDTHTFITQGVYTVTLTVTDNGGISDTADTVGDLNAMVVIYDPEGGFVTGGGWYWSSPGGYIGDPELEGKVNFGFVAKYHKGADVPKGNTEFRFKAAGMDFHSTSYDWLVIAGPRAQFKGTGTINGEGNYGFMLTVIDGDLPGGDGVDKIRMKIWDKETGIMVYDTNVGTDDNTDPLTPLGGGEIKIHKG